MLSGQQMTNATETFLQYSNYKVIKNGSLKFNGVLWGFPEKLYT